MGTYAFVAITHQGKRLVKFCNSDGYPRKILAEITAAVASAGLDAVRSALEHMVLIDINAINDNEDQREEHAQERARIRTQSMDSYIRHCRARNRAPEGVVDAVTYPHGPPDIAHGSCAVLFGPRGVDYASWMGTAQPWYTLDLDQGVLTDNDWGWCIDLTVAQNKPAAALTALIQETVDAHEAATADARTDSLEWKRACVQRATVLRTAIAALADAPPTDPVPPRLPPRDRFGAPRYGTTNTDEAGWIHFAFAPEDEHLMDGLTRVLCRAAGAGAIAPTAVHTTGDEQRCGVLVDAQSGPTHDALIDTAHDVVDMGGEVVQYVGASFRMFGPLGSHAGGGSSQETVDARPRDVLDLPAWMHTPAAAVPMAQAAAAGDGAAQDECRWAARVAQVAYDGELWTALEAGGWSPVPDPDLLAAAAPAIVALTRIEHLLQGPAAVRARWESCPLPLRAALWGPLTPTLDLMAQAAGWTDPSTPPPPAPRPSDAPDASPAVAMSSPRPAPRI